jgi:hypothetical protein
MMPLLERHFHVTLIELVAFQVAVVVACCKAHLIRVPSLDKGRGADSPDVFVVEGDNALSGAAGEMRRGTLAVEMVGGPAESAGPRIRAFIALMAWVFAMAGEAIREGG